MREIEDEYRVPKWLEVFGIGLMIALALYLIAFGVCMMIFDHEAGWLGVFPVCMGVVHGLRLIFDA